MQLKLVQKLCLMSTPQIFRPARFAAETAPTAALTQAQFLQRGGFPVRGLG